MTALLAGLATGGVKLLRWLVGSEAGRLVLAGLVAAAALWAHGEWQYQRGKDAGATAALEQARRETEAAINELASEADRARVQRRLCLERGGVWRLADDKCAAR